MWENTVKPRLSVFKGREARLNRAIFLILALSPEPLTIYEITRKVKTHRCLRHTKYSVMNRRVRRLEDSGYVRKTGRRKTQAGFEAHLYELTMKAYLAIVLDRIDLEKFIQTVDKDDVATALGAFIFLL